MCRIHPRCSLSQGARWLNFKRSCIVVCHSLGQQKFLCLHVCTQVFWSPNCCSGSNSNTLSFSFFELNLLKIKKQTFNEGFHRSHCCMRFGAVSLCCGVSEDLLDMSQPFRQILLANSYEDLSYSL